MAIFTSNDERPNPPAIIGMACRVPGATTPAGLWENILNKIDLQRKIPADRFNVDAFYHPDNTHKGTLNTKHGYFLDQPLGHFDAEFFGVSGKEAEAMDPQQRLLLEVTYEALEDAGIPLAAVRGSRTSVYCGMYTTSNDYHNLQNKDLEYYPNLTAFHLGYESLRNGEADMAIIVGSALHFGPNTYQTMSDMGFISSDARCRSFDADGSGYVRGDGVCAVVLKKQHDAVSAGDKIRAIVRSSGVNHDGKTDGITLPSPELQEALIRATYAKAGIDPDDTGYFEAHGTGTKAGDPREATAIGKVFGTSTRKVPLYMGSVKSNIGHLEGAAGLAGIIKATLAIQNGKIPPNMHFNNPNPDILFDEWKLKVPTSALDWVVPDGKPRRASINSFGYGGANAHVVLEQPLDSPTVIVNGAVEAKTRPYLLPLTSHSEVAGEKAINNLASYLHNKKGGDQQTLIRDLVHSLSTRRSVHTNRTFVVVPREANTEELADALSSGASTAKWAQPLNTEEPVRVGYVFTGQGAQTHDMGRELMLYSEAFRATLARCDEALQTLPDKPDWSIFSQPVCTAIQIALVDLLSGWEVRPSAVCGHSSGEIAAAYAAGILSLEAAIVTAYYRGLYMSTGLDAPDSIPGAMMAMGLSAAEAKAELAAYTGRLTIAAINSPSSVTASGDLDAITKLKEQLLARRVFARQLKVEQAFHSHHMAPMASRYQAALESSELVRPQKPTATARMFSSVTARVISESSSLGPGYWAANMVQPVRFSDALVGAVLDEDEQPTVDILLEVGPHPVLKAPAKEVLKLLGLDKTPYLATLSRDRPAYESLLSTAGELFTLGYPVNLSSINGPGSRLMDLPTYAWNHKNYWSLNRLTTEHLHRPTRHTLLGVPVPGAIHHIPRWRNYIRLHEIPWLRDHCVDGKVVFPAAGYCCMAIEAAVRLRDRDESIAAIHLKEVLIKAPLALREDHDEGAETMLELRPVAESARTFSDEWFEFSVSSFDEGQETKHCHGRISIEYGAPRGLRSLSKVESANSLVERSDRYVTAKSLYDRLETLNLRYGPYFALLKGDIASGPGFSVASFSFDPTVFPKHELEERTILHPTLLDSMFHVLFSGIESRLGREITDAFVSTYMKTLDISGILVEQGGREGAREYTVQTKTELPSQRMAVNHILLHEEGSGELIIEATGNEVTALGADTQGQGRALFFRQRWQPCFDLLKGAEVEALLVHLSVPVTGRPLYQTLHVLGQGNQWPDGFDVLAEPEGRYDLVLIGKNAQFSPEALQTSLANNAVVVTSEHFQEWTPIASAAGWTAYRPEMESSAAQIDLTVVLPNVSSETTQAILGELEASPRIASHIVVLSSLEGNSNPIETPSAWSGTRHLLALEGITLLWLAFDATIQSTNPEHAKILGLLRVARNENQASRLVSLDIQSSTSSSFITEQILSCLLTSSEEDFSHRNGTLHIPRIEEDTPLNRKLPSGLGSSPQLSRYGSNPSLAMRVGKIGLLETLHFVPLSLDNSPLRPDEVLIRVKASALNFHDLAVALGIIQDYNMGNECAGIVTAVGSSVSNLSPGDRVVAYRPGQGAHQTFVRQANDMCVKIPDDMSFALGASLPVTMTTAYYSLFTLGRLAKGETVLIHSAAGGVGQVAIQMARNIGARVLVTCSEGKRGLLKEQYGLAEGEMFSSRDDSFVRGVMDATGGKGVDVVINSLAGKLLHATFGCMAPFGRFIEIGKRDIHQNSNLGMDPFRKNVMFASVDMILVYELDQPLAARLLRETFGMVFSGEVRPPEGLFEYSYGQAEKAFRLMQLGRHTGKIVLTVDEEEKVMVAPPTYDQSPLFRGDKTYLLVGGLGGLGTATAEWMYLRGARRFAFMSRSGDRNTYGKKTVMWLRSKKAEVSVYKGDVGVLADVENVVREIGPSLAGVFHIAVVLQDGMIRSLSFDQYQTGLRTKCDGARNLHTATLGIDLDFFVCWSSVSAICGNKGQAAYVAANAYMDAFMRWRREQGLVGTAMNLGAVPTRGLVAENELVRKSLDRNKLDILTEQELMFLIEEAVRLKKPDVDTGGLDWHQLIVGVNTKEPDVWWSERSVFRTLYANRPYGTGAASGKAAGQVSTANLLASVKSIEDKITILQQVFIQKVATVLSTPTESILSTNPLSFYGLDSIVAVEFRKWFKETADVDLSLFDILGAKTIQGLVEKVVASMPVAAVSLSEERVKSGPADKQSSVPVVNGTQGQSKKLGHIPKLQYSGPVPVSTHQARMYARHVRANDKSQMNLCGILRIDGHPDLPALGKAFHETVRRHQALSTAFFQDGNRLVQSPLAEPKCHLVIQDASHTVSPKTELQAIISRLRNQELQIAEGEVATMTLVKTADNELFVVFIAHHICFDRASFVILSDDWMDLYDAVRSGRDLDTVPSPRITYADFSQWHNTLLKSPSALANVDFWTQKLAGLPTASTLLPFAQNKRSSTWQTHRRHFTAQLPSRYSKRLKRICAHLSSTPFHFLLAAWRAYLYRYTADKDFTILMLEGNRPHPDVEPVIGCLANVLPLRFKNDCSPQTPFEDIITSARDLTLEALAHSEVSFDDIVDRVLETRPEGHMPLGQVAINFQTHGKPWSYRHNDFEAKVHEVYNIGHPCELVLEVVEGGDGVFGFFMQHSTVLYGAEDMDRFGEGFVRFVEGMVRDHRRVVGEVEGGE
ncbi:putative polyketide synthase [Cercophora samala]|uniref:Polyketide synthase n=1 Tax=Cercophora samala TaxID=330535 RepID=A0AA39ZEE3_9PEZI|nr:putative polyketide synthase [Cercophora samala]